MNYQDGLNTALSGSSADSQNTQMYNENEKLRQGVIKYAEKAKSLEEKNRRLEEQIKQLTNKINGQGITAIHPQFDISAQKTVQKKTEAGGDKKELKEILFCLEKLFSEVTNVRTDVDRIYNQVRIQIDLIRNFYMNPEEC